MIRTARWVLALVAFAPSALAQPTGPDANDQAPPPPSAIVPPSATSPTSVTYPPHTSEHATVLLELTIDKEGNVARVVVVEGEPPFSEAAEKAAPSWKFSPARRDGTPVSARIRMRVEFRPPRALPPSDSATPPAGATAPSRAADQDVEQVNVEGQRSEVARTEMGEADVRQMPGAFGDAFRAIDAMPGVVPMVSGLPYYFIRGAPPGNTGYMIDGVRVPLLFHFGVAKSVIHPALIDHVDFYAGGYPVQYGRVTGGIIDGRTKAPSPRLHGEWDVNLLDTGAYVEAPFANGRGTVGVSGRYGYPGLLLSLLAPNVFLQYGDYQARASWKATDHDTLSTFAFGSVDAGGEIKNGSLKDVTSTQFHRVDTRWDRDLGKLGQIRTALTLGIDDTSTPDDLSLRTTLAGLRSEWNMRISDKVRIRAGSDVWFEHHALVQAGDSELNASFPTRDDVTAGVWLDAIVRVSPNVEIIPGARVDFFESKISAADKDDSVPTFDPRVATRVRLTRNLTWITTNGVTHQPPSFLVPVPGLALGTLGDGVQTAVQTSQGAEVGLPLDFTFTGTLFLHNYLDLTDATASCGPKLDTGGDCINQRVRGRTYGVELLLRRPFTKRLTGWLSYTLSRSTRDANVFSRKDFNDAITNIGEPTVAIPPPHVETIASDFDRTHVLNVIGAYDLGRHWRIGGRTVFYTGRPYSNRYQGVAVPPFNSERLPSFFRIDLRLEKRWLTDHGYVAFVAEGLNVTANKEVLDVKCTRTGGLALDKCEPDTKGSIPVIVPLIGVEGAF